MQSGLFLVILFSANIVQADDSTARQACQKIKWAPQMAGVNLPGKIGARVPSMAGVDPAVMARTVTYTDLPSTSRVAINAVQKYYADNCKSFGGNGDFQLNDFFREAQENCNSACKSAPIINNTESAREAVNNNCSQLCYMMDAIGKTYLEGFGEGQKSCSGSAVKQADAAGQPTAGQRTR
jgi:hypothetical protein